MCKLSFLFGIYFDSSFLPPDSTYCTCNCCSMTNTRGFRANFTVQVTITGLKYTLIGEEFGAVRNPEKEPFC